MRIATRNAINEDKEIVWRLYEQSMKSHIEEIWGWDPVWQDTDFNKSYSNLATFIIETDSVFAGYFQLESFSEHVYLRMLIIEPELRSKKIGAKVLAEILEIAHKSGKKVLLRVFKVNVNAKRFYIREGWVEIDEDDSSYLMEHPRCSVNRHEFVQSSDQSGLSRVIQAHKFPSN